MDNEPNATPGLPGVPEPSDNRSRPEDGDQSGLSQDARVAYSPAGEVLP